MIMLEKVKETIFRHGMINSGESVVVAFSGGPDSTALLLSLNHLASSMNLKLIVAHYNHGIRGREADEDEKFARRLTKKLGWIFVSEKMDGKQAQKGLSPEEFYRRKRYRFFDEAVRRCGASKIALGHNLHDQAETVLLHLLRGSGLEGLKGIMPVREGKFVRPLLNISREEILAFLEQEGESYRSDSTNEESVYLRNKIRRELIPYLKTEFNPKIAEALAQTAEILREENNFIRRCVDDALKSTCIKRQKNRAVLNIEYMKTLPTAIQRRVVKELLEGFSAQKNGVAFLQINCTLKMMLSNVSGRRICLPKGMEVRREYENLIIERKKESETEEEYSYPVQIPGLIYVKERKINVRLKKVRRGRIQNNERNKDYFDLDKIHFPVVLRNRRKGDWFQPLGMSGRQKLKSFFIDHKIPRQKRNEIMLLADQRSVLWIEKMHMSEQVKITPETKNILELEII